MMEMLWNFVKRVIEGINKNATVEFKFDKGIVSYFIASHDRINIKKEEEEIEKLKEEIKKLKKENKLLETSLKKKMDLNNENNDNDEDDNWESDDWD